MRTILQVDIVGERSCYVALAYWVHPGRVPVSASASGRLNGQHRAPYSLLPIGDWNIRSGVSYWAPDCCPFPNGLPAELLPFPQSITWRARGRHSVMTRRPRKHFIQRESYSVGLIYQVPPILPEARTVYFGNPQRVPPIFPLPAAPHFTASHGA